MEPARRFDAVDGSMEVLHSPPLQRKLVGFRGACSTGRTRRVLSWIHTLGRNYHFSPTLLASISNDSRAAISASINPSHSFHTWHVFVEQNKHAGCEST